MINFAKYGFHIIDKIKYYHNICWGFVQIATYLVKRHHPVLLRVKHSIPPSTSICVHLCHPILQALNALSVTKRGSYQLRGILTSFSCQILQRFYPETALQSPSVGRSGKSRRRRQARHAAALPLEKCVIPEASSSTLQAEVDTFTANSSNSAVAPNDVSTSRTSGLVNAREFEMPKAFDINEDSKKPSLEQQVARFEEYSSSALDRLNLPSLPSHEFKSLWAEVAPYQVHDMRPQV